MAEPLLSAVRVNHRFGRRVALDDVSFELQPGHIMVLVGPNGSGKTTLLRIIAGFLRPTSGIVRVFGHDPWRQRVAVMQDVRFAFAPPAFYPQLTVRETLRALTALGRAAGHRVSSSDIDEALALVGLGVRADDRVSVLSLGMRQRLALAQAILPMPRLLVLDEPTDALDRLAVIELRALLKRLCRDHGVAVLLSSHLLTEAQRLFDSVLLLNEGRVVYCGAPAELCRHGRRLALRVAGDAQAAQRAVEALARSGVAAERDNGRLWVSAGTIDLEQARVLLHQDGLALREFTEHEPSLEEAVLMRLRETAAPGTEHSS